LKGEPLSVKILEVAQGQMEGGFALLGSERFGFKSILGMRGFKL